MIGFLLKLIFTILFVFVLHFLVVYKFSDALKKKWPSHTKLFGSKHVELYYCGKDPSMMITLRRFIAMAVADDEYPFSHNLWINYAGFHLLFRWGQNYLDEDGYSFRDDEAKYYGLYSIDGEFPMNIWWGNNIYDIIWFRTKHVGKFILDTNDFCFKELVEYSGIYEHEPVVTIEDGEYLCKDGVVRPVEKIKFWIVQRRWESRFLQWLGLKGMFQKKLTYLEFETTGIGCVEEHAGYDSQVMGSDILLTEEDDHVLLALISEISSGHANFKGQFDKALSKRILKFMDEEQKY